MIYIFIKMNLTICVLFTDWPPWSQTLTWIKENLTLCRLERPVTTAESLVLLLGSAGEVSLCKVHDWLLWKQTPSQEAGKSVKLIFTACSCRLNNLAPEWCCVGYIYGAWWYHHELYIMLETRIASSVCDSCLTSRFILLFSRTTSVSE